MLGLTVVVVLAVTMGRRLVEFVGMFGYRVVHFIHPLEYVCIIPN